MSPPLSVGNAGRFFKYSAEPGNDFHVVFFRDIRKAFKLGIVVRGYRPVHLRRAQMRINGGNVIVENFLATLQKNIRDNDMDAISKMLIYPIMAGSVWLENRHDFLKYHPQIFTEKVKQELLQLQNKDILCNCRGMMINNRMWFGIRDNGKAYFYAIRGNSQTHSERD